jgi:hypothetical protein
LNFDIASLKTAAFNSDLSQELRDAAREQLRTIAGRSHDPRREDARLVMTELEPQTLEHSDGEPDPITSGFTKCFVMMAMCDEAQSRSGYPAFDYGDKEVELLCKAWHEAFKRAKAGVPLMKQLFERELTSHDLSILGLD